MARPSNYGKLPCLSLDVMALIKVEHLSLSLSKETRDHVILCSAGNNNGRVTSGPAARWAVYPRECRRFGATLTRRMRAGAANAFFTHADVRRPDQWRS